MDRYKLKEIAICGYGKLYNRKKYCMCVTSTKNRYKRIIKTIPSLYTDTTVTVPCCFIFIPSYLDVSTNSLPMFLFLFLITIITFSNRSETFTSKSAKLSQNHHKLLRLISFLIINLTSGFEFFFII